MQSVEVQVAGKNLGQLHSNAVVDVRFLSGRKQVRGDGAAAQPGAGHQRQGPHLRRIALVRLAQGPAPEGVIRVHPAGGEFEQVRAPGGLRPQIATHAPNHVFLEIGVGTQKVERLRIRHAQALENGLGAVVAAALCGPVEFLRYLRECLDLRANRQRLYGFNKRSGANA